MQVRYAQLRERAPAVAAAIADARSARNLRTRREKAAERADEIEVGRARRRRRQKEKEELLAQLSRRIRIRVPEEHRPRVGRSAARKLFQRTSGLLPGSTGFSNARGSDGLYSIHFAFTPRGLGSTKGRRWRAGEAERAARYVTREEGLEDGERGWWSNVAEDRTELVGFFRTAEALEKHDRRNANVYISEIIALPAELTARQRRFAVHRICRSLEKRGLGYVATMHLPDKAGDQRNFHCHILYSLRPCERLAAYEWSFAAAKEADINTPDGIAARRLQIVRDINATLHAAHVDKRYTHLSNKARRMAAAQPNVGQIGTWIARRLAAMEAREALLKKVQSLAGRMRSVLVDGSARLARLGAEVEHRRAETTRKSAAVRAVTARLQTSTARLAAARQEVEHGLSQRHSGIRSVRKSAQSTIGHYTGRLSRSLDARKRAIREASGGASARVQRTGRYAQLRDMLDTVEAVRAVGAVRSHEAAAAMRDQLRSSLFAVRLRKGEAATDLARARGAALNVALGLPGQLATSVARTEQRLGRAADRAKAIEALQITRANFENSKAECHRRSLLYLPAWRRVAAVRVGAMRPTVEAAAESASEFVALRDGLLARLSNLRSSVTSRAEGAGQRLASLHEQGRRLLAGGIGQGPQQSEKQTNAAAQSAPQQLMAASPARSRPAPEASRGVAAATPRRKSKTQERLREIVREHEPEETAELFPPPGKRSPAPAGALLLAAQQLEMLRGEARRREKRVREELREQALDRLKHLDIPVHLNADGYYEIARHRLTDEEMKVLMDPSARNETQRFLANIARRQHLQAKAQTMPIGTPRTRPDQQHIDPAILAAANRKSKGVGED